MTRRALGGLAAAALLALGIVGFVPRPALAAQAPALAVTSPADGSKATQPVTVVGQASMNGGRVDWVKITVESVEGHAVPGARTIDGNNNNNPLQFSWTPPLAYNGHYKITVLAQGTEGIDFNGPETSSVVRNIAVEIAPAAPTNVKAVPNQTKRNVAVSWTAGSEPDIAGYGIFRKDGDKFVQRAIVTADKTSYTDDLGSLPAGTYTYEVYAARANATGDGIVTSPPSSTASAKVTSSPPPPTTSPALTGSANVSGNGATSTTAPGTKPTALATHGTTDLSGFAALLPTGGAKLPTVRSTPGADPGFSGELPFDAKGAEAGDESPAASGDGAQALGHQTLASSNDDEPSSLRFMAAGLLVTVVLMHLLWLRDEVNREPVPAVAVDEADPDPEDA